jgi:hypothetical protein
MKKCHSFRGTNIGKSPVPLSGYRQSGLIPVLPEACAFHGKATVSPIIIFLLTDCVIFTILAGKHDPTERSHNLRKHIKLKNRNKKYIHKND